MLRQKQREVYDWIDGKLKGIIIGENKEGFEVRIYKDNSIVTIQKEELDEFQGRLYWIPSWLLEARKVLAGLKELCYKLKLLYKYESEGIPKSPWKGSIKLPAEVCQDLARELTQSNFAFLKKVEEAKKNIKKALEATKSQIKGIRDQSKSTIAEFVICGDENEKRELEEKLNELREKYAVWKWKYEILERMLKEFQKPNLNVEKLMEKIMGYVK